MNAYIIRKDYVCEGGIILDKTLLLMPDLCHAVV